MNVHVSGIISLFVLSFPKLIVEILNIAEKKRNWRKEHTKINIFETANINIFLTMKATFWKKN